jgi:8-oxo-dGTP diphosphatase
MGYTSDMEYVYRAPILTVDAVIFQLIDGQLTVLLIQRAHEPFKGEWALPGGYNAAGDTTQQALTRVLTTKTGIQPNDLPFIEQLYTFDTVARDPRGHAVSVAFLGLVKDVQPQATPTTHNPQFYPISKLPKLAYDHEDIIQHALERLRQRIATTSVISTLLPAQFTLTQLQSAYQAILGHALDKRNFRKKFLSFGLLAPTDEYYADGAHRPAMLYKFKARTPQTFLRSIDG